MHVERWEIHRYLAKRLHRIGMYPGTACPCLLSNDRHILEYASLVVRQHYGNEARLLFPHCIFRITTINTPTTVHR